MPDSTRKAGLVAPGFVWAPRDAKWEKAFEAAVRYRAIHGDLRVPPNWPEYSGLAAWLSRQWRDQLAGKLAPDQTRRLNSLARPKPKRNDASFNKRLRQLAEFKARHGHCDPPRKYPGGLGEWIAVVRVQLRRGELPKQRLEALLALGLTRRPRGRDEPERIWEGRLQELVDFGREHGHFSVPNGHPLSSWCSSQRTRYQRGMLPPEKVKRLEKIGFVWHVQAENWERWFQKLAQTARENGGCPDRFPMGHPLAGWASLQRRLKREGRLSEDRIARLESVAFPWGSGPRFARDPSWLEAFEFRRREGHFAIPAYGPHQPLFQWVQEQRRLAATGKLPYANQKKMAAAGFPFTSAEVLWEVRFAAVRAFAKRTGHCRVPAESVLGKWLLQQRALDRGGRLDAARAERLERIGALVGRPSVADRRSAKPS